LRFVLPFELHGPEARRLTPLWHGRTPAIVARVIPRSIQRPQNDRYAANARRADVPLARSAIASPRGSGAAQRVFRGHFEWPPSVLAGRMRMGPTLR
jgi:hypothetical protein